MYQRFPADGQLLLYVPSQSLLMYMAKPPLTLPGKGHLPGQDRRWTRIQGWHPNLLLLAFKNWHNEITELLTLEQHICTVWTEKKWKCSTTLLPRKTMLVHPTGSYFYLVILLIWEMKLFTSDGSCRGKEILTFQKPFRVPFTQFYVNLGK